MLHNKIRRSLPFSIAIFFFASRPGQWCSWSHRGIGLWQNHTATTWVLPNTDLSRCRHAAALRFGHLFLLSLIAHKELRNGYFIEF